MAEDILNVQYVDQRVTKISHQLKSRLIEEVNINDNEDALKSASFVHLVATSILGLEEDESLDCIIEGGNDLGIDAIHIGEVKDNELPVTIIQGKYKRNLDGDSAFPENGVIKLINAIRVIFDPSIALVANDRANSAIAELRSIVSEGVFPKIKAICCNNGTRWSVAADAQIAASRLGDAVEFIHVGPNYISNIARARKSIDASVSLSGKALVEDHPYMRALIGKMSVMELARLFDTHGDTLLERNVRRYLGLNSRVNEGISDTLKSDAQRPRFYFYNNGITIICNKFTHNPLQEKDWVVNLSGVQIVNGGQTSKTVQHVMKELGAAIENATVLVRIYELPEDDEDLVNRITQATNSQNPVDLRDLKSNDSRQEILSRMISDLGYTYRRQRSEHSSSSDITSATVAEAVLAIWRKRPHQARFASKDHFGKLYDIIFSSELNGAQAILAVLILRFCENKRKRPPEGSPEFLAYGSRTVAMIIGRMLLSDMKIDLEKLDHRSFDDVKNALDDNIEIYYQRALGVIADALHEIYHDEVLSLQRLSAAFRRGDVVNHIVGLPIAIPTVVAAE